MSYVSNEEQFIVIDEPRNIQENRQHCYARKNIKTCFISAIY